MDVADDVERALLVPQVVVELRAGDRGGRYLGGAAKRVNGAKALALQAFEPSPQLVALTADDLRPEVAVYAIGVAGDAHAVGHVEHDGHRQHVVLAGQGHELLAGLGLDVRGVDDGQSTGLQPKADDVAQQLERRRGRRLVVLVVGHETAAEVGGDDLGRAKLGTGEGGLSRAADADQHDQAQLRDGQLGSLDHPLSGFSHAPTARLKMAS